METQDEAEFCFPQLNNSCRKPTPPWSQAVLLTGLLSAVSALTVALNLLVIVSVSHFRQLHTPTNILLLSLAVSDFLVGLLVMPVEIFVKLACWFFGDVLCSLYNRVSFIITSASVGDMVLISVDRYLAICDPLRYSGRVTVRRVRLCVCLCWLCSASYSSLLLRDGPVRGPWPGSCRGECVFSIDPVSGAVDVVFTFILPILVIVVLYLRVFVVAASQARALRSHMAGASLRRPGAKRSELKAARTLGVLVLVFLLCFCPYYCVSLAGGGLLGTLPGSTVLHLFYFNSCVNPVVYVLFYPWFRKAVRLIVSLRVLQPGSREARVL